MVKLFKESHAKDLEKLAADRQREAEKKATDDLLNTPKYTVLSMIGLTSPVWTIGIFQMVTGNHASESDTRSLFLLISCQRLSKGLIVMPRSLSDYQMFSTDNQAQEPNNQINQYPKKSLISCLGSASFQACRRIL